MPTVGMGLLLVYSAQAVKILCELLNLLSNAVCSRLEWMERSLHVTDCGEGS